MGGWVLCIAGGWRLWRLALCSALLPWGSPWNWTHDHNRFCTARGCV